MFFEKRSTELKLRLQTPPPPTTKKDEDFPKKIKFVDDWLWIPYAAFYNRLKNRKYRADHLEEYRERVKLAQRRLRLKIKEEHRNKLIRMIYWHEIMKPTIPIRQYK